jgi:hypothetical protein
VPDLREGYEADQQRQAAPANATQNRLMATGVGNE